MSMPNICCPPYGPSPGGTGVADCVEPRTSVPTNAPSEPDACTTPPIRTSAVMLMLCEKAASSTDQSGEVDAGDMEGGGGEGGDDAGDAEGVGGGGDNDGGGEGCGESSVGGGEGSCSGERGGSRFR